METIKWGFAGGLLYYLVESGRLSFSDLKTFLSSPLIGLSAFLVLFVIVLIAVARWRLLLKTIGVEVSYKIAFQLTTLGLFFSTILPGGSVGGDLVKAVYIARRDPAVRLQTVATVLLDRVIGLCGMIVVGAIAFLLSFNEVSALQTPQSGLVMKLGWLIVVIATCICVGLLIFPLFAHKLPEHLSPKILKMPGARLVRTFHSIGVSFRKNPIVLWQTLGLSAICHIINIGALYLIATAISGPPPWGNIHFFSFIVASIMGIIAMALPIAPAGLGVGQYAFATTFAGIGAPSEAFGAGLVTCLQLLSILLSLIGAFYFATYKNEMPKNQDSSLDPIS